MLVNIFLLALNLYLLQEGRSQQALPQAVFFVDFPLGLLPLAYLALGLGVANLALLFFTIVRRPRKQTMPWVSTVAVAVLLGIIVWHVGFDGLWTIIDPDYAGK